ncbi:hypothetical protein N7474_007442 [Penicillium riverlandense]|uniref:uncharacterized protein n=1 Tax=Penicillium riverlandense TaxID=1903569 RepID=UPI002547FF46|nr:uncharacterized protein N7474_007442 [Penicillium riverlandense]KAJ5815665.1 hypothetical protein N7474_007442 [Penicillium riverlandense]
MASLEIIVSGHSTISRSPERCVLRASVRSEGPQQEAVSKEVTLASNQVHQIFTELSPKTEEGLATADAPVTKFSNTLLRTWSTVPFENDKPLPRVYHAHSSFRAIFRNFLTLGEVVSKLATYPKVEIDPLDWRLTDDTKKALGSESRKLAMYDAIQKANDYAEVVGQKVVAVQITDGGHGSYGRTMQSARAMAAPAMMRHSDLPEGGPVIDLTPQDIEFTGSVEVKFETVSET